jgi:hypothetical protein
MYVLPGSRLSGDSGPAKQGLKSPSYGRIRCPNLTGPVLELENLEFVTVIFHVKLVGIPRAGSVQSLLQRVALIMVCTVYSAFKCRCIL